MKEFLKEVLDLEDTTKNNKNATNTGTTGKGYKDSLITKDKESFNLGRFVSKNRASQYFEKEKTEDYISTIENNFFKDYDKPLTEKELSSLEERKVILSYLQNEIPEGYTEKEWNEKSNSILERLSFEITKLNCMNIVYNSSIKEVGLFKRYIGTPAYQALVDVIDITDVGDMASLARIGSVGVGMAIGGELLAPKLAAKGAGKIASTVGGILAAEAIGATADTGADYLRAKSEGNEFSGGEIAKSFGINYAANLAFVGIGLSGQKAVGKIYKGVKKKVVKGVSKARTTSSVDIDSAIKNTELDGLKTDVDTPKSATDEFEEARGMFGTKEGTKAKDVETKVPEAEEPTVKIKKKGSKKVKIDDDLEYTNPEKVIPSSLNSREVDSKTITGAIEEGINKSSDSDWGSLKAQVNGIHDGEIEWGYKITPDDNIEYEAMVIGYGAEKNKSWGRAAYKYLKEYIGFENLQGKSRREIQLMLGTEKAGDIINRNIGLEKASSLDRMILSAVNKGRAIEKIVREMSPNMDKWDINDYIAPVSKETKRFVASINNLFKNETEKTYKFLNEQLVRDSDGLIRSVDAFFARFSKDNDIIKSLYTGELANANTFTDAEKRTFQNFRELYFNKVLKMDVVRTYREDDEIISAIKAHGKGVFEDLLIPSRKGKEIDGQIIQTYALNPNLDEHYLVRKISLNPLMENLRTNGASDETIEELRKVIFDGRFNTKKAINDRIKQLKAEGKLPKRLKGFKSELDKLYQKKKFTPEERELNKIVKKLIKSESSLEKQRLRRIWSVFDKSAVLKYQQYTTAKNDATFKNFFLTEEEAFKKIDATNFSPEEKEGVKQKLKAVIDQLQTKSGDEVYQVERDFFGLEVPSTKGKMLKQTGTYDKNIRTKIEDIREMTTDKYIKKTFGVSPKEIPRETLEKISNFTSYKIIEDQNIKMGKRIYSRLGTFDLEKVANHYMDEFEIPREKLEIRFEKMRSGVGGSFRPEMVDGELKLVIRIPDGAKDNPYKTLGILRHELEHLREFNDVPNKDMRLFDNTIFTNTPGVDDKLLDRIANGEKISLREMAGNFYNKHFYDWRNDSFEPSLSAIEMAEKYNNLTGYEKFQMFLQSIANTTAMTKQGKTNSNEILMMNNYFEKLGMKQLSSDPEIIEEFIARRFETPENMVDFIAALTEFNGTKRFNNIFQRLEASITDENIGFTKHELIRGLKSKAVDLVEDKFSAKSNEQIKKILNYYATALDTHTSGLKQTVSSNYTTSRLVTGMITNGIIGFRHFKDVYSAISSTSLQYIVNGEYAKGMKVLVETIPDATKMVGASITQATSNLLESTQRVVSAGLSNNIKGYNVEVTALDSFISKLRNVGSNTQFVIDSNQRRIVAETLTSLNLLQENIDRNSLKGIAAQHTMRGMLGLQSDDIFSHIMAVKGSQSELYDMISKNSFDELNKIQKFMMGASGYTHYEFNAFKEEILTTLNSLGNKPLEEADDFLLRAVLNSGETQLDLMGRAKTLNKGTYNPFMYLTQTIWHLATETISDIGAYSDYGVYVGRKGSKELMETLFYGVASTLSVAGGAYIAKNIKKSLVEQQLPFQTFHDDVKELSEMKTSQLAIKISRAVGDVTPLSLGIKSSEFNAPYQVWFDIARTQYKKGDLPKYALRFYYGSMVGSMVNTLTRKGDDKELAYNKAMRYMTTPKGKKQFIDYTTANVKKDAKEFYRVSKEKYFIDNREALKNGIISQDEYTRNIKSIK